MPFLNVRGIALVCGLTLAAGAGVLAAASAGEPAQQVSGPLKAEQAGVLPAVQWVGADSNIDARRVARVRTPQAWAELWAQHTGKPGGDGPAERHAAPKIDFSRFEVIAIFGGVLSNTDGFVAEGVVVAPDGAHVRYVASSFQSFSANGPDRGVRCTPFGLWVIARTAGPVILHEGRQTKSGPTTWVEAHRLPATEP